jgi:hypothetical protein
MSISVKMHPILSNETTDIERPLSILQFMCHSRAMAILCMHVKIVGLW